MDYSRPRVADVTSWRTLFDSSKVKVEKAAQTRSGQGWLEFYRVTPAGERPIYKFGESAWSDAARVASDFDFRAWGCTQ